MDFEWSSQPLTISSILSRFSLPVLIKPAPGQHGSDRPILLYTIARLSFAIGTILRVSPVSKNGYEFYRPIESEFVAVPLEYPGKRIRCEIDRTSLFFPSSRIFRMCLAESTR